MKIASNASSDAIRIHLALRQRNSSFSDVARRCSKRGLIVTPSMVRGVVYGYTTKHSELVLKEIESVLRTPAARFSANEKIRMLLDRIAETSHGDRDVSSCE